MSIQLKGTKTEANLRAAFSGESQARNRYTYYSEIAKKEGHDEIAKFFEDTANNERIHAKVWFKLLNGDVLPDTKANLAAAMEGERFEHTDMYPAFAKVAKEEGFDSISALFAEIAAIEKKHEEQCKKILDALNGGTSLELKVPNIYCLQCGRDFAGDENVQECPICNAPPVYFMGK